MVKNIEILEKNTYSQLVQKIKKEITQGLERAKQAYDREKIITYWKIGEAISKHLLKYNKQEAYGKKLFKNLSQDLNIGERLLYQIVEFYKTYPKLPKQINLKWSHYRLLTSVKDEQIRGNLEEAAISDNWSHATLQENVREEKSIYKEKNYEEKNVANQRRKKQKLSFARGKLFTYEICRKNYANQMVVDLGFNTFKETDLKTFSGKIAQVIKVSGAKEKKYRFKGVDVGKKHLYTYKAYVEKIIDGDTLWVNIDCGFKIWLRQKLRLRGIDTPDIETREGKQALRFVRSCIEREKFIIIKSHGRDKYARHLVDIFYKENEEDPQAVLMNGKFLNQELVEKNLAEIVI